MAEAVEAALRAGDPAAALALVMDEVRASPTALEPRMALFQLACVEGQWDRAGRQLEAMAQLDPETALFGKVYSGLIAAEAARRAVALGREPPVTIGEPPAFVAMLAQAFAHDAAGQGDAASALRRRALDAADAVPGELDGARFAWLMDADPRFGPTLEVIVNGAYRWLPLGHLRELRSDGARDLKDVIWLPVTLVLATGAEVAAHVPVRYPGSETDADPLVRLARVTVWDAADPPQGLGQRLLASDVGDHPILALHRLRLPGAPAGDG